MPERATDMAVRSNGGGYATQGDMLAYSLIVIIAGLAFGAVLLWYFHHGEISAVVMRISHWEMEFIAHFSDRYRIADRQVLAANPQTVTIGQLEGLVRDVGTFFRLPAAALVVALGVICLLRAAPG